MFQSFLCMKLVQMSRFNSRGSSDYSGSQVASLSFSICRASQRYIEASYLSLFKVLKRPPCFLRRICCSSSRTLTWSLYSSFWDNHFLFFLIKRFSSLIWESYRSFSRCYTSFWLSINLRLRSLFLCSFEIFLDQTFFCCASNSARISKYYLDGLIGYIGSVSIS